MGDLPEKNHTDEDPLRVRIRELETELSKAKSDLAIATQKLQFTDVVKNAFEQDLRKNALQEQAYTLEVDRAKYQAEANTLREQVSRLMQKVPGEGEIIVKPNMPSHKLNHRSDVGFVIMPFGPRWSKNVEASIRKALRKCKLKYRRADKLSGRHIMLDVIWRSICECGLIVADVTDCNPNVLYELGLAEVIGKK